MRAVGLVFLVACGGPELDRDPVRCGGGPGGELRATISVDGTSQDLGRVMPIWHTGSSDQPSSLQLATGLFVWGFGTSAPNRMPLPVGDYADLWVTLDVAGVDGNSDDNRVVVDESEPRDGGYCLAGRFVMDFTGRVDGSVAGWFRTM